MELEEEGWHSPTFSSLAVLTAPPHNSILQSWVLLLLNLSQPDLLGHSMGLARPSTKLASPTGGESGNSGAVSLAAAQDQVPCLGCRVVGRHRNSETWDRGGCICPAKAQQGASVTPSKSSLGPRGITFREQIARILPLRL